MARSICPAMLKRSYMSPRRHDVISNTVCRVFKGVILRRSHRVGRHRRVDGINENGNIFK